MNTATGGRESSLCSLFIPLEFTLTCVDIEYTSNSRVHCLDWSSCINCSNFGVHSYLCTSNFRVHCLSGEQPLFEFSPFLGFSSSIFVDRSPDSDL